LPCLVSDTVTTEAGILRDHFTQLSLSKGPEEWATKALEALQRGKYESALEAIFQSDFYIQRGTSTLADLYAAALGG